MKTFKGLLVSLAIVAAAAVAFAQVRPQVKNYFDGCRGAACDNVFNVEGTQEIESGGIVDFKTGAIFKDAGADVTADLRAIGGAGLDATELGFLDGVTAGTAAASKAVVLDASSKINSLDATVLKANGVTVTNATVGVAASYKIARAETALDGSNPTSVASGLTTILACTLALKGTAAPGVGTSNLTGNISGTNFDVYAWKVTTSTDNTLIASTGTESFYTVCVGT